MGRALKAKAGKAGAGAAQKRRKKTPLGGGGSSPALSAASSGGSTPGHRDCEQCGNSLLLEGVAKSWPGAKKSVASTGCQICDFVAFRRSQRPCVQCARTGCDHFCEWCGKGFHAKCAKLRDEDVDNQNGFCCHKCESEQSDGHDTDEEEEAKEEEEDVGSRCGSCREPFSTTGKEEDGKPPTGFKVNQAVLVDNEEVLYNALITEVDGKAERIKIHFTRWSKSFDDWYNMDDEHINESLACDCCNQWFHIGCLPPIKSSGRWKDSTYVCPRCIDDARAFHNGNRSVLKEKAAYISTSKAISANARAAKRATSPKESENTTIAVAKTNKPNKALVVVDDDDEDMEADKKEEAKEEENNDKAAIKANGRRKRKLSDASDSAIEADAQENEKDGASVKVSAVVASSVSTNGADTSKEAEAATEETNAAVSSSEAKSNGASVTPNAAEKRATMHASPEHTIKTATEAHSSPSKAAASKIGVSNKQANSGAKGDKQAKTALDATASDASKRRNVSSCNSVMSILNSPPTNEVPSNGFKPTVTSLPMLNPPLSSRDTATITTAGAAAKPKTLLGEQQNLPVYVKMEKKNGQFSLYPKAAKPGQAALPATAKKDVKATKAPSRGTKRRPAGASTGPRGSPCIAFDILHQVASETIGGEVEAGKLKGEKQPSAGRTGNANKRAKTDAPAIPSSNAASSGRPGPLVHHGPEGAQQSRDRIQMNSFVDLHFSIRKEMYLRFCRLEEEGMLTRDSAHVLRSLIYPTSDRFQDLKFVYLVNKDLPSVQLTKRLLEAVPYPPPSVAKPLGAGIPHATGGGALRSPINKGLGLPVTMGMFPAGMTRPSVSAGATHMSLLPPPPGSTLMRPEPPRPSQASRIVPGSGNAPRRANVVASVSAAPAPAPVPAPASAKRPEMLLMEQLAPTHRPVSNQQQQQQQRILNSR